MSTEATSALTFNDLIKEVARAIGVGYYGSTGDGALQIPTDAYDLDECKRLINNGIRMFINDAPPGGWRWMRPIGTFALWPDITTSTPSTLTAGSYDSTNDQTKLTAAADAFYGTMEEKAIAVTGGSSYTIKQYIDAKNVYVYGDASGMAASSTWTMASNSAFTLPRTFGGQVNGEITFAFQTDRGIYITWCDETVIRQWRSNLQYESGTPLYAAVRPFQGTGQRRRWELLVYPEPDEVLSVEFPYTIQFDLLSNTTDVPPSPVDHDEALKAACIATAEKDVEDMMGPKMSYYQQRCLPESYRIDSMSAPRRLGYFGNAPKTLPTLRDWRQQWMQRPPVTFNP